MVHVSVYSYMDINYSYRNIIERIASNIRQLRTQKGLTQEDMVKFGFSYRHYQRLESGRHAPSIQTLFRLSVCFNVNIKVFFD